MSEMKKYKARYKCWDVCVDQPIEEWSETHIESDTPEEALKEAMEDISQEMDEYGFITHITEDKDILLIYEYESDAADEWFEKYYDFEVFEVDEKNDDELRLVYKGA